MFQRKKKIHGLSDLFRTSFIYLLKSHPMNVKIVKSTNIKRVFNHTHARIRKFYDL